jgi:hypothetical protein
MSRDAAISLGCMALALGAVFGALRCLADRMLTTAAIYTVLGIALLGGAVRAAIAAF